MSVQLPISGNEGFLPLPPKLISRHPVSADNQRLMDDIRQDAIRLNKNSPPEDFKKLCYACANLVISDPENPAIRVFVVEMETLIDDFADKEARTALKTAIKLAENLPREDFRDDFDQTIAHLCNTYNLDAKTVQKEANLLNCSPKLATLMMMKRLTYRLKAGLSPMDSPTHSPSIAQRSEQTAIDPSQVRTIEKMFSKSLKSGSLSAQEFQTKDHTFYILGNEITVEENVVGQGGFKTCRLAKSYFSEASSSHEPTLVTLRPTRHSTQLKPSEYSQNSFDQFDPNHLSTSSFRSWNLEPQSPENELTTSDNLPGSMVVQSDKENTNRNSFTDTAGSMVILSGVSDGQLKIPIDFSDQLQFIRQGSKSTHFVDHATEQDEYEREIALTQEFQGEGIIRIHSVISLESGDRVMVQEAAGFEIGGKKAINFMDASEQFNKGNGTLSADEKLLFCSMIDGALAGSQRIADLGYIHRDLKELNMLISAKGEGLVSDFGLTVKETDNELKKRFGGTPGYIAPEVVLFSSATDCDKITKQSDIWSWAMILQNIFKDGGIAAHPIFEGLESQFALIGKLSELKHPKKVAEYEERYKEPEDSMSLDHLLWSATRIDPQKRPTISELRQRFQEIYHSPEFQRQYLKIV